MTEEDPDFSMNVCTKCKQRFFGPKGKCVPCKTGTKRRTRGFDITKSVFK